MHNLASLVIWMSYRYHTDSPEIERDWRSYVCACISYHLD